MHSSLTNFLNRDEWLEWQKNWPAERAGLIQAWLHCFLVSWVPPLHCCTDLLHSFNFSACCSEPYLATLWSLCNQQTTLGIFPKDSLHFAMKDSKEIQILFLFFFVPHPFHLHFELFMTGKVRDELIISKCWVTVMFSKTVIICASLSSSLNNFPRKEKKKRKILVSL